MSSMILLLPDDVIHDILLRLPAPSVFDCKFVCKTWFSLISNSKFVKHHLDHTVRSKKQSNFMLSIQDVTKPKPYHLVSTQNYDDALCSSSFVSPKECTWFELVPPFMDLAMPIHLLGTCNGLFCIMFQTSMADGPVHFLVIWNPTTGEYKIVPHSQTRVTDRDSSIYSFGYDHKNDDYKVLKGDFLQDIVVNWPPSEEDVHISEVYSLRSDSWRSIKTIPYHMLKYIPYDSVSGVLVNGRRHWLANNRRIHLKDLREEFIVSFDFSEETFKQMHLPKGFLETDFWTLGVLEDRLCVTNYGCKDQLEIWVMQDYGIRESWRKYFAVNVAKTMASPLRVTWSFKDDMILFKSDCRGKLVIYDPKHDTLTRSWLAVRGVENYVESLVPQLWDLCGELSRTCQHSTCILD